MKFKILLIPNWEKLPSFKVLLRFGVLTHLLGWRWTPPVLIGLTFPIVNVINFLPLDQQLLRFSSLLDHITEMACHLFKSVQFDFEEGNFKCGLILNY